MRPSWDINLTENIGQHQKKLRGMPIADFGGHDRVWRGKGLSHRIHRLRTYDRWDLKSLRGRAEAVLALRLRLRRQDQRRQNDPRPPRLLWRVFLDFREWRSAQQEQDVRVLRRPNRGTSFEQEAEEEG